MQVKEGGLGVGTRQGGGRREGPGFASHGQKMRVTVLLAGIDTYLQLVTATGSSPGPISATEVSKATL